METILSAVILVLCIAAFVYFCLKGVSPLVVGICCTLVVSFVTQEGFVTSFFTTLPESIGSSIPSVFFLCLLSSVLGELYGACGFAQRMGLALTSRMPRWAIPLIISLLSALFNLAGIPRREFIIAAIAFPVLYAANLPLYFGIVCDMGATTIIGWCTTGLPGLPNILAGSAFGISELAYAGNITWPCLIFGTFLLCGYILLLVRRTEHTGEGYSENGKELYSMLSGQNEGLTGKQPPLLLTFVPILIVLAVSISLSSVFHWNGTAAAATAQLTAILFLVLAGRPYMDRESSLVKHIVSSAERSCPIILTIGVVTAFAVVVSHTPVYQGVMDHIFQLSAHPYVLAMIIVAIIALLTSDGISTLLILQEANIASHLLSGGVANAGALATISRLTSACFGTMPWSVAGLIPMQIYGLVNKTGFIKTFMVTVFIPFMMTLMALALSFILY